MPGLEFPNIQERIVTYESARKIIDWGHRGWTVADSLRARVAELETENRELRQGLLRSPAFDNIEGLTPDRFPPGKFKLVIACPSCGIFVPQSQIKH